MLGAVKRQRHILLCEILHLYDLCCRVVVVVADGYNHIVTNGNIVLIGNVIIAFVTPTSVKNALQVSISC